MSGMKNNKEELNPFQRFAKLEKITRPAGYEKCKLVQNITEVTGKDNIIIPCTRCGFYDIYDIYAKEDVKIFQTDDRNYWVVIYNE
jgi:predicted nucleic-acid-binding Zn-ribbon protein